MKGYFSGLIGISSVAAILFLALYFFVPDVSIRFFGIAFNAEGVMDSTIHAAVDAAPLSDETKSSILSSLDDEAIDALLDAAGDNVGRLMDYLSSEEGQAMMDKAAEQVSAGAGSLAGYFSSDTVRDEIASV